MALTFIGVRGSGKSAVAAAVAARLGRPFADADAEIERRAGRSIREIFDTDGEPTFRELERWVMADLLADSRLVIAAGGGAVLSPETRTRLRASGPVLYLRVGAETAERRIAGDASTAARRPALTALPFRAEIEAVMVARELLYRECATATIETDGLAVAEVVEAVLKVLPPEFIGERVT